MKYTVVHDGNSIIIAQPHNIGDAVATPHNVLIDTYDNLVTVLTALNIDAQPLHTAKEDYERYQQQLNETY